jgi:hypothetical protein
MTITESLRESKAYYTVAGAGDLAAEKLRGVRENVGRAQERVEVRELPGAAAAYVTNVGVRTREFIDGLAERGRHVVHGQAPREIGSKHDES